MSSQGAAESARRLHERGEAAAIVADQLLRGTVTEVWAVPVLRRAAHEAARAGNFERAAELLRRSLSVPSPSGDLDRVRSIIELGRVEAAGGFDGAAERWRSAADQIPQLDPQAQVCALADLGETMYSSGLLADARDHFARAHRLIEHGSDARPDEETVARVVAGLSTTSLLTGRRDPAVARRLRSLIESPPHHPDLPTRALMASAAGEVALGVDLDAAVVHRLVDTALGESPLPAEVLRPAVESVSAALSLTGRPFAAIELLDQRLRQASAEHDAVAHVSLLPLRAHAHFMADQLQPARSDADAALDLIERYPAASGLAEAPSRYALALALIELDDLAGARRAVDVADHRDRWGGTPMHGWFLDGLARVQALQHHHLDAIGSWREAARAFTLVGGSGRVCAWRDGLARSLAAIGKHDEAEGVAAEQVAVAAEFGDRRMMAIASATVAALDLDHEGAARRLGEAIAQLPEAGAELPRCVLGWERGARLRRAGRRRAARDQLITTAAIASRLGARRLVRLIDDELTAAGAASGEGSAARRYDELTNAEYETAKLAIAGLGNSEIAQRRAVSRKTIEAQLSSVYRKLGISDRTALRAALESRRQAG